MYTRPCVRAPSQDRMPTVVIRIYKKLCLNFKLMEVGSIGIESTDDMLMKVNLTKNESTKVKQINIKAKVNKKNQWKSYQLELPHCKRQTSPYFLFLFLQQKCVGICLLWQESSNKKVNCNWKSVKKSLGNKSHLVNLGSNHILLHGTKQLWVS